MAFSSWWVFHLPWRVRALVLHQKKLGNNMSVHSDKVPCMGKLCRAYMQQEWAHMSEGGALVVRCGEAEDLTNQKLGSGLNKMNYAEGVVQARWVDVAQGEC